MSSSKLPINRTTIRGAATLIAGVLTIAGAIPAEAQAAIVENAELAFGAVTTLWGVFAFVRGLGK